MRPPGCGFQRKAGTGKPKSLCDEMKEVAKKIQKKRAVVVEDASI